MKDQEKSKKEKGPAMRDITDPSLLERVATAQDWLRAKYTAHRSWPKVASEVGKYSGAALCAFAGGNYPSSPMKIVEALEHLYKLETEREETVFAPDFVNTDIAYRIRQAVRQTRLRGSLGIIAGRSGVGKTTALTDLAKDDETVIYIRANTTFSRNVWAVATAICNTIGVSNGRGMSPVTLYEKLQAGFLARRGCVLIIDEAQFLCRESLDLLRTLSEDASLPIVFSGNETLHEFAFLAGVGAAAFVQFTSRCTVEEHIQTSDIAAEDVEQIAAQIIPEPVLTETMDVLVAQARAAGGFRRLQTVIQRAYEKAKRSSAITPAHVFDAANAMSKLRGAL